MRAMQPHRKERSFCCQRVNNCARLDAAGIGARGGGGEQPLGAAYLRVVEDGGEVAADLARATVGFVRHGQIERGDGRVGLGGGDDGGGLVGGEHHAVACAAEEILYLIRIRGDGKGKVGHAVDGFIIVVDAKLA